MNRLVIKIAIVNLQDSDIKLDVFRYFNNKNGLEHQTRFNFMH